MLLRPTIAAGLVPLLLSLTTALACAAPDLPTLTLAETERLALVDDPALQRLLWRSHGLEKERTTQQDQHDE